MERLIELTAEYLRTRKQFGVPLASFQAMAPGDYFKRLAMIDPLLGGTDHHLDRYAALLQA
ncbi:acyl-CoA dehydrogenase [Bordetella pertussis]|nr:acyl-CoA dehydrogenase [Bordetella pertussis]